MTPVVSKALVRQLSPLQAPDPLAAAREHPLERPDGPFSFEPHNEFVSRSHVAPVHSGASCHPPAASNHAEACRPSRSSPSDDTWHFHSPCNPRPTGDDGSLDASSLPGSRSVPRYSSLLSSSSAPGASGSGGGSGAGAGTDGVLAWRGGSDAAELTRGPRELLRRNSCPPAASRARGFWAASQGLRRDAGGDVRTTGDVECSPAPPPHQKQQQQQQRRVLLGGRQLPEYVKIVEVGPRDGLQNEKRVVPTAVKLELIRQLAGAGLPVVEATSFVSPKWIPQLADSTDVMSQIERTGRTKFPVLTPNLKQHVAGTVVPMLEAVMEVVPASALAVHFHDTYGQALVNIFTSLQGASGNVATEDVVYLLNGLGIRTNVDIGKVLAAGDYISKHLGRQTGSRTAVALMRASSPDGAKL
eukprot:jgi/Mesen1/2992/ME000177S02264